MHVPRRAVLIAALASPLAACGVRLDDVPPPPAPTRSPPSAEELVRRRAVTIAAELRARVGQLRITRPDLAPLQALRALDADLLAHSEALGAPGTYLASPTPSPPTAPSRTPARPSPAGLVTALSVRAATPSHDLAACGAPLARLLVTIGAARAAHADLVAAAVGLPVPATITDPAAVANALEPLPEALRRARAGELAAAYALEVVAARLAGADPRRVRALALVLSHERSARTLARADPQAPGAAPGYVLPRPVDTVEQLVDVAALVEERLAAVYADAVAGVPPANRAAAAAAVVIAARRAAGWRGSTTAFPGSP